jgi:3-hydroxyisobutyrate dehydrogenase
MTENMLTNLKPDVKDQSIGLIGAGRMGTGMGLCLLRHGAALSVKSNARREGIEYLKQAGASEVNSIPEIAKKSNIIVLSLPSSREVEQVCLTEGLFQHLKAGALVIDCTTATPSSTVWLAAEAKKYGVHFVDAPVTRSPENARQGTLNAMVGADDETFQQAANVLAAFCETATHVGSVGEGHKMKLVYKGMTMGIAAVAAETCQIAEMVGIDLDALRRIVARGSTNSGIFQKMVAFQLGEQPETLASSIADGANDMADILALATEADIGVPVLQATSKKLHEAVVEGHGALTLPHLIRLKGTAFDLS